MNIHIIKRQYGDYFRKEKKGSIMKEFLVWEKL